MMFFLLTLFAFIYDSNAVHLSSLLKSPSQKIPLGLKSQILGDPAAFVATAQALDHNVVKQVIDLLEGLVTESGNTEKGLETALSKAKKDAVESEKAVAAAVTVLDNAETALENAETVVKSKKDVVETKKNVLDTAKSDLKTKEEAEAAAQKAHDDQIGGLTDEQSTIREVIAMLRKLLPSGCVGNSTQHAVIKKDKVIVCKGSFTGHPKDANFCGAGWHTCTGKDIYSTYKINKAEATSFTGCYAYNSMNDCHGCWESCKDNATPVKGGGCLDRGSGHDLAALGKNCNVHGTSSGCIHGSRSDIRGYDRSGCIVRKSPANGGVVCCLD